MLRDSRMKIVKVFKIVMNISYGNQKHFLQFKLVDFVSLFHHQNQATLEALVIKKLHLFSQKRLEIGTYNHTHSSLKFLLF